MSILSSLLLEVEGFDWDAGNDKKNINAHQVSCSEAEEVFFNRPLLLQDDFKHSQKEIRYHAFGVTNEGRKLALTFTIRRKAIRIISARDMNKKERNAYEQD